jgi:aminopeptidase N
MRYTFIHSRSLLTIAFICLSVHLHLLQAQFYCRLPDPNATPREHAADIKYMKVDLNFMPEIGKVSGTVTHTFSALRPSLDSLFFDAPGIKIISAKLDGADIPFSINANGVTVSFTKKPKWDEIHNLAFNYEATPKKGIYFIGWNYYDSLDKRNKTRRQIWTQGEGIDNRYWIPMYDNMNDKFITETIVHFDSRFKVLSNGILKSKKNTSAGITEWDYSMTKPHAGYLLMLAIDEYAVKSTKTSSGVPVNFWYYPEHSEKLEPTSRYAERIIEFLENETGVPYPWEEYSQVMVQDFMYGAMENTTATVFGDFFLSDSNSYLDRNYVSVDAHELTHQWFGDLITARSDADIWLQESWATYYPKQFFRMLEGEDKYQWLSKLDMLTALKAAETDNNPVRYSGAGTARVYQKGSVVIDMLRYVLGDEEFKRVVKYYLTKYKYENVETNDLYQAVQDVLGESPDWFFEEWLYHGGEPNYKISYAAEPGSATGNRIRIKVEQVQEQTQLMGLFKMPVNLAVYFKNGDSSVKKVWVQKQSEDFYIENNGNKEIDYLLFDPGNRILKKISFSKSAAELSSQAMKAANMIDRYDAYMAMRSLPVNDKREVLVWGFNHETFYGIRAEIIKQMMEYDEFHDLVKSRLANENPDVIKSFINSYNDIPAGFLSYYEVWLSHRSYEIRATVLQKLYDNAPAKMNEYLDRTASVQGQNNNLRIKWLELAILTGRDKEANTKQLISLTSPSYEFRTRVPAFEALKRLNIFNPEIISNAFQSLASFNGRLSGPVKVVMDYFVQEDEYKKMVIEEYKKLVDEKMKLVVKGSFGFLN